MLRKLNGMGPNYCKYCGGEYGIHQENTMRCPNRGEDQSGLRPAIFQNTTFEPQEDKKDIDAGITQGRTVFDDYFLAAIQGMETISYPHTVLDLALEFTVAALKKRNEYLSGEKTK
jgi:hypothetical protein